MSKSIFYQLPRVVFGGNPEVGGSVRRSTRQLRLRSEVQRIGGASRIHRNVQVDRAFVVVPVLNPLMDGGKPRVRQMPERDNRPKGPERELGNDVPFFPG